MNLERETITVYHFISKSILSCPSHNEKKQLLIFLILSLIVIYKNILILKKQFNVLNVFSGFEAPGYSLAYS